MKDSQKSILKLVYAAACLALAMVLPFLTGQIPQIGKMLSPMHIPAFLCGFLCGPVWGLIVGCIAPLLRSLVFSMPKMMPTAAAMAFELATYGFFAGLLSRKLPKNAVGLYCSLILAMILGRIVWGVASFLLYRATGAQFTLAMFWAGGFVNAVPGIILHLILVPAIVLALRSAHLVPEE